MDCVVCSVQPVSCLHGSLAGVFAGVVWMDGVFTSCGPALLFVWGIIASAFGSPVLKVLIPPADPEDLLCFRPSGGPSQPALLWFSYSIQHVLFITCCHGLSEAAVTNAAFPFMERLCWRHNSNRQFVPFPLHFFCFVGIIQRRVSHLQN